MPDAMQIVIDMCVKEWNLQHGNFFISDYLFSHMIYSILKYMFILVS